MSICIKMLVRFIVCIVLFSVFYIEESQLKNVRLWMTRRNFLAGHSISMFYGKSHLKNVIYQVLDRLWKQAPTFKLICLFIFCFFTWLQCLSIVPLEIFRWVVAGVAGFMSAAFVAINLRAHIKSAGERWFLIVAAIFLLQLALSVVLKMYLFTVTVWVNHCFNMGTWALSTFLHITAYSPLSLGYRGMNEL